MKSIFKTYCSGCDEVICTSRNSTYSARNKTPKLNLLTVASARNNGIGYSKLTNLSSGMNLPVFHLKTYQLLSKNVHNAAAVALEEHFTAVAEIIKTEYKSYEQTGDIVDIAVSFDGTWHKRGHTSLFGVGAVIDLLTGLVVDVAVMSKYCHGCSLATTNPERYRLHQCQINYDGSSGAMEVEIALLLFQRSVSNYRLRYTTMLSDGDCKSYTKLKESNMYGEGHEIIKEECINHVSKRMGSALRKLKESSKQSGMSMGGKGRLTNEKVELIQNYYGKALKDNAPDIEKMRNAVYASLFHMVSTDNEPHHTFCPTGSQSWCHYNRAIENPAMKRQHKPTLPKDIGEALLPIYKRLTATELLERCTKNKTQNTNESLHSIIWQKCPKANFASLSSVTTAASLAVLQYNKGPKGFYDVLSKLHIEVGKHQEEIASRNLKRRLDDSARFSTTTWKVERKGKKLKRLKAKDKQEETMYEAGAF